MTHSFSGKLRLVSLLEQKPLCSTFIRSYSSNKTFRILVLVQFNVFILWGIMNI